MWTADQINEWPVDNAALAVVSSDGLLAQTGDLNRVFALASVTKLLVAYAVLIAVEEGAIELDEPAGPPGSTVRHLLAHTSGLFFAEPKPQSPPGRRRTYSSAGYDVLGEFVEQKTSIPFPEYLHDAVFAPLGMTTARLVGPAGHGAEASVADLTAFARELFAPRLIAPATLADATSVQFAGLDGVLPGFGVQRPNDWGLGFEIRGTKHPHWTGLHNSENAFGHFGQSGTFLWCDPAAGLATVCLTDRPFGDWARDRWPTLSDAVLQHFGHKTPADFS